MAQQPMYPAKSNSPITELAAAISAEDTTITLLSASNILEAPNLFTLGNDETAEIVLYTEVVGTMLTVTRGFGGTTAKAWPAATKVARNFSAYDHESFRANISDLDTRVITAQETADQAVPTANAYTDQQLHVTEMAITALEERLDTADTVQITLQPDLQIVNADKDSRFKLGEIKGRTLINLINNGNFDSLTGWNIDPTLVALDTSIKYIGESSAKVILGSGGVATVEKLFPYDNTKNYVFVVYVRTQGGAETRLRLAQIGAGTEVSTGLITSDGKFSPVFVRVPAGFYPSVTNDVVLGPVFTGASGTVGNVDACCGYEISQAEYDALASMTPEQVAAKYPFMPSGIVGVENPYAIGYGENLLPPFNEQWATSANVTISQKSPYEILYKATGTAQGYAHIAGFKVLPNTDYTFSAEHNLGINVHVPGVGAIVSNNVAQSVTFNTGSATILNIGFVNGSPSGVPGDYVIKNPMLVLGAEVKPFKPQRKSMLALQTTLHANPTDGSEQDVLFEKEGQYFKLAKWKKSIIDGSYAPTLGSTPTGYKVVRLDYPAIGGLANTGYVTKYDGKVLSRVNYGASTTAADQFVSGSSGDVHIAIANTDSGWGDSYTPTAGEIKVYFMGWKMYHVESSDYASTYNGTGTKRWVSIGDMSTVSPVLGVVPTTQAPKWNPYQLLYRLAKDIVEPVPFEGALILPEGQSVIDVGTGIVLRESVTPKLESGTGTYWLNIVNSQTDLASQFAYKTDKIMAIYADSMLDSKWNTKAGSPLSYGAIAAAISDYNFDPTASYTVTYIKLDKSPIQPITGKLAANEKAQISDLMEAVSSALSAASVVGTGGASQAAIGSLSSLKTDSKGNLVEAVNELFTDVSDGKTAVATAITGKGVTASGSDTFQELAGKVGQIPTELPPLSSAYVAAAGTMATIGQSDKLLRTSSKTIFYKNTPTYAIYAYDTQTMTFLSITPITSAPFNAGSTAYVPRPGYKEFFLRGQGVTAGSKFYRYDENYNLLGTLETNNNSVINSNISSEKLIYGWGTGSSNVYDMLGNSLGTATFTSVGYGFQHAQAFPLKDGIVVIRLFRDANSGNLYYDGIMIKEFNATYSAGQTISLGQGIPWKFFI
ncbi:hypothetical protein MKZ15_15350 [Paenibacillus sp. FSL R7-0216]|uniref:hypothetical protein n=1 Tax=Paenibacillus sp. FSL R7-0216 TaxID=2921677 RepID=UPI0030DCCE0C